MNDAATRLTAIHDRIAHAAGLARRKPEDVTLVAVSKTHEGMSIKRLIEAGHRVFGENRVQEAQAKWPALRESHPQVELQDGPDKHAYVAREVTGDEKAAWWERAVAAWPDYAEYQKKTDREIPVFVLERA